MKNILKFSFILLVSCFFSGCNLAPGSYPYSEDFELPYSQEVLKTKINSFKQKNPEFKVPQITIHNTPADALTDGPLETPAGAWAFYFYYRKENEIVMAYTQSLGENKSKIAFVSVNPGLDLGVWKDINKDFSNEENKYQIEKFRIRILGAL